MEFNIALNTIVYLMVFLFPGIIFRKFLFIREYSKEFDKGNLFERFVWTLFTSIIILCFNFFIFSFLNNVISINLIPSISYETIRSTFLELTNNQLPDIKNNNFNTENDIKLIDLYCDFLILISSIYLTSSILGVLSYYFTKSKIVKLSGVFKYSNYWEDLVKGTFQKNLDDTVTYAYTLADVLIQIENETILYTGKVENYYIEQVSNRLQLIVLTEAKKYKYDHNVGEFIIKIIPGNSFIIEKDKIVNINFHYINEKKDINKFFKRISNFIDIISALLIFFLTLSLFFKQNIYIDTFLRKIVFTVFGILTVLIVNNLCKIIFTKQLSRFKFTYFFYLTFTLVPFIWLFNFLKWYWALIIFILILFIASYFTPPSKKTI